MEAHWKRNSRNGWIPSEPPTSAAALDGNPSQPFFPGCKHTGESHRRGTSPAGFGVGLPLGWGCHSMRNSAGGPSPPSGSTNVCFHHVSIKPHTPKAMRYLRVWQTPNQPETQTQHTKEPPLQPPANGRTARRYSLPEPRRPAVRSGVTPATRPWGRSRGLKLAAQHAHGEIRSKATKQR